MTPRPNTLSVPEISGYRRTVEGDHVVVRYLIRNPGELAWRAVEIARPIRPEDR